MPSKSPKQEKFMRAIAHGWKPSRMKNPPSRAVGREFMEADMKKYSGGFAESRYAGGGPVHMQMGGLLRRLMEENPQVRGALEAAARGQPYDPGGTEPTLSGLGGTGEGGGLPAPPRQVPITMPSTAPRARPNRSSPHRDRMRAHKTRIADILQGGASASVGRVKSPGQEQPIKMEEGGAVPGHLEGKNPYNPETRPAAYALWEHKNHVAPPPPPPEPEEEAGWLDWLMGSGEEVKTRSQRELEAMGEADGGYINMQAGGLAQMMAAKNRGFSGRPGGPIKGGFSRRGAPPPQRPGGPIKRGFPGQGAIPQPGRGGGRGQVFGGLARAAGAHPGRGGMFNRATQQMRSQQQRGGGFGRPGRMPLPGGGGGGPPGGARVPPNMKGYLQQMRIQNRPRGPAGGGTNRVGQRDQQGGLSRALQRGTGRPPMSRRSRFPGGR